MKRKELYSQFEAVFLQWIMAWEDKLFNKPEKEVNYEWKLKERDKPLNNFLMKMMSCFS